MVLLMEPEARRAVEARLAALLAGVPQVVAAWVFGTFASGQPFEDLDLGLVLDGAAELDPRFLSRLAGALERATGRPRLEVDLVDLRATPPRFQHAVTSQGRLLCCRDRQARLEYEARLMSEYLDYKPVDEFFDRVALERARGGGVG